MKVGNHSKGGTREQRIAARNLRQIDKIAELEARLEKKYQFNLDNEYLRPVDRPYGTIGDAPLSDILFDVLVEFKSRGTLGNALKTIERRTK